MLDVLRALERPAVEHGRLTVAGGRVELDLPLARHEVTFVELMPVRDTHHEGLDDRRILGASHGEFVLPHERHLP